MRFKLRSIALLMLTNSELYYLNVKNTGIRGFYHLVIRCAVPKKCVRSYYVIMLTNRHDILLSV
jgi:hypothetical protein